MQKVNERMTTVIKKWTWTGSIQSMVIQNSMTRIIKVIWLNIDGLANDIQVSGIHKALLT